MTVKELIDRLKLFDASDEVFICEVSTGATFIPEEECAYDDKGWAGTQEEGKCFLLFEAPFDCKEGKYVNF